MSLNLYALLEEVAGLLAHIGPDHPFAHIAQRHAALATHMLETALTAEMPAEMPEIQRHIRLLRAIAKATLPVTFESAAGDVDLTMVLIEDGTIVDDAVLWSACAKGYTEIVRLFLENGVDAANNNISLFTAIRSGHTEIVRLLLELPLERGVSASNNLAFYNACASGYTEIVRLLLDLPLERGVAADGHGQLPFTNACRNGHTEIVRLLLDLPPERGVDPREHHNLGFREACRNGHTEIVRLILDKDAGADYNEAFCDAELNGHTDICALLSSAE